MSAFPLFDLLLALLVLGVAIWTVSQRDLMSAVIGFSAYGLLMGLVWVRLHSIDVALTEAAVGGGVTSIILFKAATRLRRTRALSDQLDSADRSEFAQNKESWSVLPSNLMPKRSSGAPVPQPGLGLKIGAGIVCTLIAACLAALVLTPPVEVRSLAPLAAKHLPALDIGNPVTATLIAFRGLDTLLEKVVLMAALVGVWSLTPDRFWGGVPEQRIAQASAGALPLLARLLAPLAVIFAIYQLWIGATAPGGVFQGGAIVACAWLLLMITGQSPVPPLSARWLRLLLVIGPLVFIIAGFAGIWLAGSFLGLPAYFAKAVVVVIEAALMVSIAVTLAMMVAGPASQMPAGQAPADGGGR